MKKVYAYLLFTIFFSFTAVVTTYGLWGDTDTLVSISISEEEEEEEQPTPINEENKEYITIDYTFIQREVSLIQQQKDQFAFTNNNYEDVHLQSVYSPPDELIA